MLSRELLAKALFAPPDFFELPAVERGQVQDSSDALLVRALEGGERGILKSVNRLHPGDVAAGDECIEAAAHTVPNSIGDGRSDAGFHGGAAQQLPHRITVHQVRRRLLDRSSGQLPGEALRPLKRSSLKQGSQHPVLPVDICRDKRLERSGFK